MIETTGPYSDQALLHALQIMLCTRLDDLLMTLGVTAYKSHRYFIGPCPVHGGRNPTALNLYRQGNTRPGYWICNTKRCHECFGRTILGFIRGVLSQQKKNWGSKTDPKIGWKEAVDWCCDFLGTPIGKIKVDREELEKLRFASAVGIVNRSPQQQSGINREAVIRSLAIPAAYYLGRGYLAETLDRYDVGLPKSQGRELSGRVVVPIYDADRKVAIGFSGRALHAQCKSCDLYHASGEVCPKTFHEMRNAAKWKHSGGFAKEHCLYNWWFAKEEIRKSRTFILCEGPGEIWRLEEAGIRVGLAMFGVKLSDQQQVILERSGASNGIIVTNEDDAGRAARTKIRERLGNLMRLHFPTLTRNDLGDTPVEQVKAELNPILERIKARGY